MEESRVINLEIKYAHMEEFLDQLNKVITDQQKIIERLEKEILDLKRNVNSANGVDSRRSLKDDIPPHY